MLVRICLNTLFLKVVKIEPDINRSVFRNKLRDVSLEEGLSAGRHVTGASVAHLVVPDGDILRSVERGVGTDPCAHLGIGGTLFDLGLKCGGIDPGGVEEHPIQRAIEMVLTGDSSKDGAALVEGAGGNDESSQEFPRAARKFFGEVFGEELKLFVHSL